jgi:hypothetical protein
VTLQSYTALWPVTTSGTAVAPGGTLQLDDASPTTQAMLGEKVIELSSSPTLAAHLASANSARAASQYGLNATPLSNDYPGTESGDVQTPGPLEGVDPKARRQQ